MSATAHLDLPITGMTCAGCAGKVERRLNSLPGVHAEVNLALERAAIDFDPAVTMPAALVGAIESIGYHATLDVGAEAAEIARDQALAGLRRRMIGTAVLTAPVLLLAMVPALQFPGWGWASLALATPAVYWGGWPIHRATLVNLRHGSLTMDTLITIGSLAAYWWSVAALTLTTDGEIYLEVASVVILFILAGRYYEGRARRRAGSALRALLELGADEAARLRDGIEERIPVAELRVGDLFVVRPGDKIATDGVVVEGASAIDRSLVTGESAPVDIGPGDAVIGATLNVGGRVVVRAVRVGSDTALAQIARLVEEAQSGKAPVQRLADRVAAVFVPVVMALAIATTTAWLLTGASATTAFSNGVAVLVIACPCALGLATPTALLVGTGRGAQLGILIRGPEILERTRDVDTILLDKTGTLTTGKMRLVASFAADGEDVADVLRMAGGLERASEHPIGRAIAAAAGSAGPLPAATAFVGRAGLGVEGVVEGRAVRVERAGDLPPSLTTRAEEARAAGQTPVIVSWDGRLRGLLVVADTPRPTSAAAVRSLRELGLEPVLVTGDSAVTARAVADLVGIEHVVADVLPEGKAAVVRRLQAEGRVVAMAGDGVNDAPALAQADLGLAMSGGTDAAIAASDITLVAGDLAGAPDAIRLSRRTLRTIEGNLVWAFGYNVAAIPLAMAGLLNPMIAAGAMACSSLFVVSNSLRLRRFRPART
jgi:Cu+-exporting ATPase